MHWSDNDDRLLAYMHTEMQCHSKKAVVLGQRAAAAKHVNVKSYTRTGAFVRRRNISCRVAVWPF